MWIMTNNNKWQWNKNHIIFPKKRKAFKVLRGEMRWHWSGFHTFSNYNPAELTCYSAGEQQYKCKCSRFKIKIYLFKMFIFPHMHQFKITIHNVSNLENKLIHWERSDKFKQWNIECLQRFDFFSLLKHYASRQTWFSSHEIRENKNTHIKQTNR